VDVNSPSRSTHRLKLNFPWVYELIPPMDWREIHVKDEAALKRHILGGEPSLYVSSRTSTVMPYEQLRAHWRQGHVVHLGQVPGDLHLLEDGTLRVRGAVSWKEAREFLEARGRMIQTSPTEELALMLAGVATSCTGERCFAFGNLRRQIRQVKYLNHRAEEVLLRLEAKLSGHPAYAETFEPFQNFKNAPFPRFEREIDLMIGTEGQLGVIVEADFETAPLVPLTYAFLLLPRWEESFEPHLELHTAVQGHRGTVLACELIDSNGMKFVPPELRLGEGQDVVFLEIRSDRFEPFFEEVLSQLSHTPVEKVFEISEAKYHTVRKAVPRGIFEANSRKGVSKQGTDVQVAPDGFEKLLKKYREAARLGIDYLLFGHFGDAHLHFNFNLTADQKPQCETFFRSLYTATREWGGSPFAEHGIGILKLPYIQAFHGPAQRELFQELKNQHDPRGQFFPGGFMSSKN
jgi:FAD/FMN-containing dehydrogenase